jgi:hypothetical protein
MRGSKLRSIVVRRRCTAGKRCLSLCSFNQGIVNLPYWRVKTFGKKWMRWKVRSGCRLSNLC